MRAVRLALVASTVMAVVACSGATSPAAGPASGTGDNPTGRGFSCDSSWACLKDVAATAKYPVMAPTRVAQVVVPATLDVHPSTASERVSYTYALPGSNIQITVMGTRGPFFTKMTRNSVYTMKKTTVRSLAGELWSTSTTPRTAILWWQEGGWTWRISGQCPDVVTVLTQQAGSLRAVAG